MNNLTKRQREVYQALVDHFQETQEPLSLEALCLKLGLQSRGSLHKHVQALVNADLVKPLNGKQRGIQLKQPVSDHSLPLLGKIAAGNPIEALENPEPIQVPDHLRSNKNCFVLQVCGDSMINDGILDGDWVIIAQTNSANNGDIVVALIGGEQATLKRIQFNQQQIILHPANSNLQPLVYNVERVQIQGKLIGQMRSYQ